MKACACGACWRPGFTLDPEWATNEAIGRSEPSAAMGSDATSPLE
jgi:hypothetical protein